MSSGGGWGGGLGGRGISSPPYCSRPSAPPVISPHAGAGGGRGDPPTSCRYMVRWRRRQHPEVSVACGEEGKGVGGGAGGWERRTALLRGGGGRVGGLEGGKGGAGRGCPVPVPPVPPPQPAPRLPVGELRRAGERVSSQRGMCVRGKAGAGGGGAGRGSPLSPFLSPFLSPGGRSPAEFEPRFWVAPRYSRRPRSGGGGGGGGRCPREAAAGVCGRAGQPLGFKEEPSVVVPAVY